MIGSPCLTSRSLGDEASGTGSPTTPIREDVDLAEVNGPVVTQSNVNEMDFGIEGYVDYRMERRHVAAKDSWAFLLLGQWFRYKELELEDDLEFKAKHPSNRFRIYSIVNYNGSRRRFINASVNYADRNLYFVCNSVDAPSDYELISVLICFIMKSRLEILRLH